MGGAVQQSLSVTIVASVARARCIHYTSKPHYYILASGRFQSYWGLGYTVSVLRSVTIAARGGGGGGLWQSLSIFSKNPH